MQKTHLGSVGSSPSDMGWSKCSEESQKVQKDTRNPSSTRTSRMSASICPRLDSRLSRLCNPCAKGSREVSSRLRPPKLRPSCESTSDELNGCCDCQSRLVLLVSPASPETNRKRCSHLTVGKSLWPNLVRISGQSGSWRPSGTAPRGTLQPRGLSSQRLEMLPPTRATLRGQLLNLDVCVCLFCICIFANALWNQWVVAVH